MRKRRGPRTVPWGTPERTGDGSDLAPSTSTVCVLLVRKEWIHFNIWGPIPSDDAFARRILWSTLSNALLKSKRMASVWLLELSVCAKSLAVVISCVSQLLAFLNPCWRGVIRLFESRCFMMLLCTMCSKSFDVMLVREIGL